MLKGLVFHGSPSFERRRREIEKAYRDKDARLQAIWLIRLGDSNPVDPRRCRGIVYSTAFVVYQEKGTKTVEREKRRPLYRCHAGEIRILREKLGRIEERRFPFIHQIDDMCTRMLLSSYLLRFFLSFLSTLSPIARTPFLLFRLVFHPLLRFHVACPFDRIVNFLRQLLWNMLRNHDTICPIATRLIADPCHIPFTCRSLPCKHI